MPTSYSLTPSSTTVVEANTNVTFTVSRSGDLPAETIYVSTLTGTASSSGGDYDGVVNQTLTFSAGQSSRTFTIGINEDTSVEASEQFRVMIARNPSDGSSQALDISTVTITDDDAAQATTYSLTPSSPTVVEDNTNLTFTVTRSGGLPAETIYVSTLSGTASSSGGDYDGLVNQALTFSDGQTSRTFTVGVNEDTATENTEEFRVMIGRNPNDSSGQALDISTVTITDDDAAQATSYSLTPSSTTVTEDNNNLTFTVTRSGGLPAETIYVSTLTGTASSSGGDYDGLVNQALTFGAGQTSATFTVGINEDSSTENTEEFRVMIGRNPNDSSGQALDISTVTINDDDAAQATTYSLTPSSTTVVEDNANVTFTVTRSGGLPAETIYVSTLTGTASSSGGDYDGLVNQGLTFSSGQTSATFTVGINEDTSSEGAEEFRVMIGRNPNDTSAQALDISTVTITDDDAGQTTTYSLTPGSTTVVEDNTSLTFTVTRSGGLAAETIYVSTLGGTASAAAGDYDGIVNQALTFTAGQASRTFTVGINEDSSVEATEQFRVMIGRTEGDSSAQALDISDVSITDDDATGIWSIGASSMTFSEGQSQITFSVVRPSGSPAQTVYVSTTQDEGSLNRSDYVGLKNQAVTFAANETTKSVVVNVLNDSGSESSERFGIIVQRGFDDGLATYLARGTFTIVDDDVGAPQLASSAKSNAQIFAEFGEVGFLGKLALAAYHLHGFERIENGVNNPSGASTNLAFDLVSSSLRLLTANDLPGLSRVNAPDSFGTRGLSEGVYTNLNAAVLIGRSADGLFIAFRGTNDKESPDPDFRVLGGGGGSPDEDHWFDAGNSDEGMAEHYALLVPLLEALGAYIGNAANGIQNVYVTGHSLGAAMAQEYMRRHPPAESAASFSAVTFANPGFQATLGYSDPRLVNIVIDGDPAIVGGAIILPLARGGQTVRIGQQTPSGLEGTGLPVGYPDLHSPVLYAAVAELVPQTVSELGSKARIPLNFYASSFGASVGLLSGSVDGSDDADFIRTGSEADQLRGELGNDFLYASDGNDTVDGGIGDDTIVGGAGAGQDTYVGGPGIDTVDYSSTTLGVTVDLDATTTQARGAEVDGDQLSGIENLVGGAGADTLSGSAVANNIAGGDGDDLVFGRSGQDYLRGGAGSDRLDGGADFDDINGNMGNDTANGGDGADWVVGGKDNDLLFGDAADDIVYGNLGNDTCEGGTGADLVRGGQGDDLLRGGDGADFMSGDRGADTISGGLGADLFNTFAGAGTDRVLDFSYAQGDRVRLEGGIGYTLTQAGADAVITLSSGDVMTLVGVNSAGLPAGWIILV